MYREYLEHLESVKTYEINQGFIQYKIENEVCYISSLYVKEEFRGKGYVKELESFVLEKAKDQGCKEVFCQVDIDNPGIEKALLVILSKGYKIIQWDLKLMELSKGI